VQIGNLVELKDTYTAKRDHDEAVGRVGMVVEWERYEDGTPYAMCWVLWSGLHKEVLAYVKDLWIVSEVKG
jgi:hypothetical protein